ncbi:MAG: RNA 2',3'-cyclic phosphodiesterase [Candidatus Micrarchaeia archaeon]
MRCFIAAEVSGHTRDMIANAMRHTDKYALKVVGPELMHITIKFLGDISDSDLEVCKRAVDDCAGAQIPIKVVGGGAFPNPYRARVIYASITSPELYAVADCIRKRTSQYGDNKPFVGHLTVARTRNSPINATGIIERLNTIRTEDTISKISIKKSTLTPSGPIYEDIHTKILG